MKTKITVTHPEYDAFLPTWLKMRDSFLGAGAVKSRGRTYLPAPEGMQLSNYGPYVQRAEFFPAVSISTGSLVGAVCGAQPGMAVPDPARPWLEDVDLADTPLAVLIAECVREAVLMGRGVLVTDWSASASRPYITRYDAEDLVHWQTARIDGDEILVRAVFKEAYYDIAEDSSLASRVRYREYYLGQSGDAFSRVWLPMAPAELKNPGEVRYAPQEPVALLRRQEPLNFIPVVIFGATRLSPQPEKPPLHDLAQSALEYYAVSADYKLTLHWLGCPVAVIAGDAGGPEDEKLRIAPNVMFRLRQGATWGVLTPGVEGVAPLKGYLDDKKIELAQLGAKLLEEPHSNETATAVMLRRSGADATLRHIATTVESAVNKALNTATWWAGYTQKASVTLNKDFVAFRLNSQEQTALLAQYQAGAVSYQTYFEAMQRGGIIPAHRSLEEELELVKIDPLNGGRQ